MPFPNGWPPRPATGVRSLRAFATGTCTNAFGDNAVLWIDITGANPFKPTPYVPPGGEKVPAAVGDLTYTGSPMGTGRDPHDVNLSADPLSNEQEVPKPMIWSNMIQITNDGPGDLEFSFDGINIHGIVRDSETRFYEGRIEAGISLRGIAAAAPVFRVEAW